MADIQIFRPGPHYPALDGTALAATAAAYDPLVYCAPLVVGHPAEDAPRYGLVQGLTFADGVLSATVSNVARAIASKVAAGRLLAVSASFFRPGCAASPSPEVYALRHVGLLGATPPVVKGLAPPVFRDSERAGDVLTVEFVEAPRRPGDRPRLALPPGYTADPGRIGLHSRTLAFSEKHDCSYEDALVRIEGNAGRAG